MGLLCGLYTLAYLRNHSIVCPEGWETQRRPEMVLIHVAPIGASCSNPAFQPGDPGRGAVDVRRVDSFVVVWAAREDLLAPPIHVPPALFFGRNGGLCRAV